ncbi:MAG: hypothetical protein JWN65_3393 [Solirubrobacterales bacterium]|nr:hypothetical protein [Solirubrobacterales bacterium]
MLASGIALLVIGLIAAIACFFWKRSSQKSSGWWAAVQDVDIATALKTPEGTAVAVAGTTVAPATEAGAVLQDPVHGTACCWWRETITEHWEERVRVAGSTKDHNGPDHRWEERSNQVSERVSGVPFVVEDGARISVDLQGIDIDGDLLQARTDQHRQGTGPGIAEAVVDGLLGNGGRRDAYTETKIEILPANRKVLVSGRAAGATIVADGECGLQVCEGTVERQLGDSRRNAKRAHLGLVIGSGLTVTGAVLVAAGAAAS